MYVDPRVAHGRATFDLNRSPRLFPEERRAAIRDAIVESIQTLREPRNRRNLMRLLERQIAPKLSRMGLEPYVGTFGQKEGLLAAFVTMSAEHGLREFQMRLTVPDLRLDCVESTVIRPHAVARCMQRNGVLSLEQIEHETATAFVLARVIRPLARVQQWKQIGIPTSGGLFIGEFTATEDVAMQTYLHPADNGRPSRWEAFAGVFREMPRWSMEQIHQGSELLQWMINHIVMVQNSGTFAQRFPFLLEPHVRTGDPLDDVWDPARRQQPGGANP